MRGPGGTKRQKERQRLERRAEKERRKAERRAEAAESKARGAQPPDEDPDIAGIVPGPQPRPWEDETAAEPGLGDDADEEESD